MRKSIIQIAAQLIVIPCIVALGANAVKAETVGPIAATELLAKSYASNGRCNFLNAAEADELGSYVARAEVAVSEQAGVSQAKAALTRGKTAGQSSSCSAAEKIAVAQTLVAARSAIAALGVNPEPIAVAARQEPDPLPMLAAQSPKKLAKLKSKRAESKLALLQVPLKVSGKLSTYQSIAQKYYLARRCQNMSQGKIAKFYQTVVATHKNSVATYGVSAVSAVMRKAESNANAQGCT